MALNTGQDLYSLCKCIEAYPKVFDAFHETYMERIAANEPRKESFLERRERTRAQRLARFR